VGPIDSTPEIPPDRQLVQGYHAGGFTAGGVRYQGSVIVFPDRTVPWAVATLDELTPESLEPVRLMAPGVDILLVGTGAKFRLLPPALRQAVRGWGPVVEAMATPAACRTYNVLLSEERRVAAALIVVGQD
jgi:uncharacterized protein